jgi:hypothetical protein
VCVCTCFSFFPWPLGYFFKPPPPPPPLFCSSPIPFVPHPRVSR